MNSCYFYNLFNSYPWLNAWRIYGAKYSRMDQVKFVFHKFYLVYSWRLCPIWKIAWKHYPNRTDEERIRKNFKNLQKKESSSDQIKIFRFAFSYYLWKKYSSCTERKVFIEQEVLIADKLFECVWPFCRVGV